MSESNELLELRLQVEELKDKLNTANRKFNNLSTSYRGVILSELLDKCKLIPLKSARSGLFEEDLKEILSE